MTTRLITLPLKSITIDPSIQQRIEMDPDLVAEYQTDIKDWIQAAPVVVFASCGVYWLSDGFHRVYAADEAGLTEIPAIVHQGGKADALRYALGANARHGKRRSPGDLAKAYRRAVAEQMLDPGDVEAVASLLNCSRRAASDLTRAVREQVKAERDATIQKLADEGKTQREIAASVGMTQRGVGKAIENKRHASESSQTTEPPVIEGEPVQEVLSGRKTQSAISDHQDEGTDDSDLNHPEPVIIEAMPGDDLDAIRAATAKLGAASKASTPTPTVKGPTAKDAMHAMLQVTGALGRLREFEDALLESDAQTLMKELRKTLERLVARFEQNMEGGSRA